MSWVIDLTVSSACEAISAMCDSTGPATSMAIGAGVGVEEGAARGGGIGPPWAGTCCGGGRGDDDAVSSDSAIVELKSLSSELWDNGDDSLCKAWDINCRCGVGVVFVIVVELGCSRVVK
jgi:hypothetical protein